ncbi:MAG: 50S ribosomal protein L10 [Actinobacteria bacterium]|nr:50S ribosomal protein L10 [Actinomycetota bacterium]
MPSKEKKERVKQIRKWFEEADSLLVLKYRGLRVAAANQLRVEIKDNNAELRVLKNTLTRLALADTPREEITPLIDGPIAVVFTNDDMVPVAKVIKKFSLGHDELFIMGGVFQGTTITAEQAAKLATLPPRDVMLARVVGQVAAPLSGLVGVCAGPIRKMLGVLAAVVEKKEKEPGSAETQPDSADEGSEAKDEDEASGGAESEQKDESGPSGEESPGEGEEATDKQER